MRRKTLYGHLPVCNTSSRPQGRWTFPQRGGDSGLLPLPAWQKASGARGWGGGTCDFHLSVFSPDTHLHQCRPAGSGVPPTETKWVWSVQNLNHSSKLEHENVTFLITKVIKNKQTKKKDLAFSSFCSYRHCLLNPSKAELSLSCYRTAEDWWPTPGINSYCNHN